MSDKKKATCPAPSAIVAACDKRLLALQARSPAAGYAQIIAEGLAILARAGGAAPKLAQLCHGKYPQFDRIISTHIPATLREQARQLKQARAFGSFQEIYLEAILEALVDRGLLTAGLDAKSGDGEPAEPQSAHRRAA
jgi:hypothetical protein